MYPKQLCRAICRGLLEQMSQKDMEVMVLCRISQAGRDWMAYSDIDVKTLANIEAPEEEDYTECVQKAWCDVTDKELRPERSY